MKHNTKGEMGIGTLIIFIALLLVAAIAAGVLIQTAGSLQEKALTTGDQAKGQIATNVRVVEVSATDGSNGTLRHFIEILKLAPGSDPIKLDQTLLTVNTFDTTGTLTYAGNSATATNGVSGYYTNTVETISGTDGTYTTPKNDYDRDGSAESLSGGVNNGVLTLVISGAANVDIGNCSGGALDVSIASNDYLQSASGDCSNGNVTSVTLTPVDFGKGVYSVEYIQQGANNVAGNLQRGDVIKIYYEAPRDISGDEKVRINFIPKIGTPTLTEFITANVISTERVYLYP